MTNTILISEKQPLFRSGIRAIAESLNFDNILECATGDVAWRNICKYEPDVAIISSDIDVLNAREISARLVSKKKNTKLLSVIKSQDIIETKSLLASGISGVISENCIIGEISTAIEQVCNGDVFICDSLKNRLEKKSKKDKSQGGQTDLSYRELDVLECVAKGFSNKEISFKLDISIRTVEAHRRHIRLKTTANSVAEMTLLALKLGLIPEWSSSSHSQSTFQPMH